MLLAKVFSPACIKLNLESEDKDEVFEELTDVFLSTADVDLSHDAIVQALHRREAKLSTGIKKGVGLPHAKITGLAEPFGLIGISEAGIDYEALDGSPVHVVFMLLSTDADYDLHLRILRRLSLLLEDVTFLHEILEQKTELDVYKVLCRYEKTLIENT